MKEQPTIGAIVSYEDMANPREEFVVISSASKLGEYNLVRVRDGIQIWSGLRGHGWKMVRA